MWRDRAPLLIRIAIKKRALDAWRVNAQEFKWHKDAWRGKKDAWRGKKDAWRDKKDKWRNKKDA